MLEDVGKDIQKQLYERVRSPFLGSLALAWVAWNFRSVLALLSTMSVREKLIFWAETYPTTEEWLIRAIVLPFVTTVLFILLYPYPARWTYHYWHWQRKKLKEIEQRIDDVTPLTQAEAKELRRSALEQQMQLQNQVQVLLAQIRELTSVRDDLKDKLAKAIEQQAAYASQLNEVTEKLRQAQLKIDELNREGAAQAYPV